MRLLNQLRGIAGRLRRRERLWSSLIKDVALMVVLAISRSRAIAWEGKKPQLPDICMDISDLGTKPSMEAHQAELAEGDSLATANPHRLTRSADPSRLILHSPCRRPLESVINQEATEFRRPATTLVEGQCPDVINLQARNEHIEPQLNSRSEFDLFAYLLRIASIGLPLRRLAANMGSEAGPSGDVDKEPSTSSPDVKGKSTSEEFVQPETEIPGLSTPIVKVDRPADDYKYGRDRPVWIRFEPMVGPWVSIAPGDQFVATHDFPRFGIQQWEVGSVIAVTLEETPTPTLVINLILGFPVNPVRRYTTSVKPPVHIEDSNPEPFLSTPFVLLDKGSRHNLPVLRFEGNEKDRVQDLTREGTNPFLSRSSLPV